MANLKKVYILFMLLGCGLAFFDCAKRKYEEDPKKTTKSPQKRLLGTWSLVVYTLNGESIVAKMNAQFGNRFDILNLRLFYREEKNSYSLHSGGENIPFYVTSNTFFETSIKFGTSSVGHRVNDTVVLKWLITPFRYKVDSNGMKQAAGGWEVTKLFDNELNLRMRNDTGEFRTFWRK